MKRLLSILLMLSLILTAAIPAFAEESDSKGLEKAILAVKNVVTIPSDYKDFQYSSSQYEKDGEMISIWYLNWNKEDYSAGISASVENNGYIINYNRYTNQQKEGLGNVTREAGKKTAADFLAKVRPDLAGKMKLVENNDYNSTDRHYYAYRLFMNDVPVNFITASVEVDKHTGEVIGFIMDAGLKVPTLPSTDGIIGLDAATKAYLDKIGVKLSYYSYYDYNKKELKIFPAYAADNGGKAINAKTGEVVRLYQDYGIFRDFGGAVPTYKMESTAAAQALTREELDAVDKISNVISKEKAESLLRSLVPGISSDMKVTSTSLSKNYIDSSKYVWEIGFDGAYGIINAKTGELVSFYIYKESSTKGSAAISEAKAREKAEDFMKKVAADKFSQSKYYENYANAIAYDDKYQTSDYSFNYYRQVNGIDFVGNGFTVIVNKASGMITHYDCSWYESATFPSIDKVMTKEAAFEKINATGKLSLLYKKVDKGDIALVYDYANSAGGFLIDPNTGAKIGWDGNPYKEASIPQYTDLSGHWSETTVMKLLENGYYLEGEKFNPNQKITQMNFLRYLYSPIQMYYTDDDFYKMLINDKIVKDTEKAPKAELTRQDAAKFTVRFLGQGKSAEHPEIFVNPFKDSVSPSYKGYAAICYGLGVMKGDTKGRFNGTKAVTNAEAASIIYNALQVK
ncbi:S-layer homology domain-containing protein [Sinanaerobacter chloroacetimidivorans]|uniref:S-layer homology domain-containing protein n=1 Tax=Sinanaerobacter chloroacetimidivorans TaxID=2818044 RepID=A0A8J7VZZ8_9FIRM|nr:S-layer homology domain-containing protein [Sinanaerobacter chloroacetimidivorans]MBR0596730.1 S-layer homology domain-containing protein [Sinanaerobacter chloroacetimidivorans]